MLRVRVPAIQVRDVTPGQPRTRHVTVRVSFWIEGRDESEAEPVDVRFHEWTECRGFYENHEWQRDEAIREAVSDWLFRRIRDEHEDYPHAKEPCAMVSARLDGSDHVRRYAVYLDHDRGAEFDATEFTDDCQEVLLDPYPPRLPRVATHERRMPSDDERRLIEQNKMLRSALRSVLDEARYLSESSANADWRKLSDRDVVQAARRLVDMDHGRSDLDPEAVVRGMADIRVGAGLALDEAGSSDRTPEEAMAHGFGSQP